MTVRSGYALPLTLAAIVVIALVATMAAEQVRSSTRTVTQLTDQIRARTLLISAEQTLIYTLLTEPMVQDGVAVGQQSDIASLILGSQSDLNSASVIRANGQAYRLTLSEPVIARLYDDQTFFNAASNDAAYISDILDIFQIPSEQHSRFAAALRDYQDEDDLRSLGGAEAPDYDIDGLPTNAPLRDPMQLCTVKYWSESPVCEDASRLILTFRARSTDALNPALASEPLIDLLMGEASLEDVRVAHQAFGSGAFTAFNQIGAPTFDIARDPLDIRTYPGPQLSLITHTPDGRFAQSTVVELTPNSLNSPFVVHGKYVIGGNYSQDILRIESIDDVAPLPQPNSLQTER